MGVPTEWQRPAATRLSVTEVEPGGNGSEEMQSATEVTARATTARPCLLHVVFV